MTSKERLTKGMARDFGRLLWRLRDGAFYAESYHRIEGLVFVIRFERRRDDLALMIELDGEEFAAARFHGERCFEEACDWASDRITNFTDRYAKAIQTQVRAEMTAQIQRARLDYAAALCGRRDAEDAPGVTENSRCP